MAINTLPDQYVLGKGRFHFAQRLSDGTLDGFRFIGNVPAFTITPSSDTLTHTSSMSGINVTDRDIQTSSDLAIGFTTDNMSNENKALWAGGTVDTQTVTALTAQTETIANAKVGFLYPLGDGANSLLAGAKDITVTAVTNAGTAVPSGNYSVNSRTGMIAFTQAYAGPIVVTYNVAASTRDIVNARSATITGAVKFISDNPDTGSGKLDFEYFLPSVRLSPDGDWGLIGDDWQSFGFTGTVLQLYDIAGNPVPRFSVIPLTAA